MKEKEYVELVPKVYEDCLSEFEEVQDKQLLWDLVKYKLTQASIDFGKTKAQSRRHTEEYISEQLKDLEQKLAENKDLERNTKKYEHLKGDLEKLYDHKIQGVMLRSKTRWHLESSLEKRNQFPKQIGKLQLADGKTITGSKSIL